MGCLSNCGMGVVVAAFLCGCGALDSERVFTSGGITFRKSPKSYHEMQFDQVVIQQKDYSCGTGALATVLNRYFGASVSELALMQQLLEKLTPEEVKDREENGFSMLDLKQLATGQGCTATGVRVSVLELPKLKVPAILMLQSDGLKHFVVFNGVQEDRIHVADPTHGNVRIPVKKFVKQWNGVALVVTKGNTELPVGVGRLATPSELGFVEVEAVRNSINRPVTTRR